MGYDNNSFNFNYDCDVEIIDCETGKTVCKFEARENSPLVEDAGFEAGGVASGGHNYSVATNAQYYEIIKPFEQQAIVDGVEYKIMNKSLTKPQLRDKSLKTQKRETIIYLG